MKKLLVSTFMLMAIHGATAATVSNEDLSAGHATKPPAKDLAEHKPPLGAATSFKNLKSDHRLPSRAQLLIKPPATLEAYGKK